MSLLVNGEYVDDTLLREEANLVRTKLVEAMPDDDPLAIDMRAWEWARENVIERVLLRQAALNDPTPLPAGVVDKAMEALGSQSAVLTRRLPAHGDQDLKNQVEVRLRVERLIAALTAKVPRPSGKEIAEYYRQHRENFYAPELVHAGHIVKNVDERIGETAALAAIQAAQTALGNGRPFAEVADEHSDCPGRGGELGWFVRGQMVDEFDAVIFALPAGEISEIFRTPFGFHIAIVYEKRAAGLRPLHEVRDDIERGIYSRRREEKVEQFVDRLRAAADIRKAPA